jgi:DNA polymerase-3 subunit epsilon
VVKEKDKLNIQPSDYSNIDLEALKVNSLTIEQLKTFTTPKETYNNLIKIFSKYIDKFNRNDKFIAVGYNVGFDINFMRSFFLKQGDKYFGSWIDYHTIDVMQLAFIAHYLGKIKLENYKLETLCNHFGISIKAHDALEDIVATRSLFNKLIKFISK